LSHDHTHLIICECETLWYPIPNGNGNSEILSLYLFSEMNPPPVVYTSQPGQVQVQMGGMPGNVYYMTNLPSMSLTQKLSIQYLMSKSSRCQSCYIYSHAKCLKKVSIMFNVFIFYFISVVYYVISQLSACTSDTCILKDQSTE